VKGVQELRGGTRQRVVAPFRETGVRDAEEVAAGLVPDQHRDAVRAQQSPHALDHGDERRAKPSM